MQRPIVHLLKTGLLSYKKSLQLQKYLVCRLVSNNDPILKHVLILTEHNPVYTIGIRTKDYTISDEQKLRNLGAEFHKTNRGGLITFHGPGQLVAYPILNLKQFKPSLKWYVCTIEKTVIDLCNSYNINARTTSDVGIWVDNRKICAIGIHGTRYVTSHGLALNCNTDLHWFDHIVPCGLEGKEVTSISKELNRDVTVDEVTPKFIESFEKCFNALIEPLNNNEQLEILEFIDKMV